MSRAFADSCRVSVDGPEAFELALRRFMKAVKESGVLSELRRREAYEPPSVARRRKAIRARARRARAARRLREHRPDAGWKPTRG